MRRGAALRLLLASICTLCSGFMAPQPRIMRRTHAMHHISRLGTRLSKQQRLLAAPAFYLENPDTRNWVCPTAFVREALRAWTEARAPSGSNDAFFATMVTPAGAPNDATSHEIDPLFEVIDRRLPIPVSKSLPGVYLLGMADIETFASLSWFVQRPGGNVMIDVPQFNERTADELSRMGGVQMIVITHEHSAGDYMKWLNRFPDSKCVSHRIEGISSTHYRLERDGPWHIADDLHIFISSGHTAGSIAVLFHSNAESVLFSGDQIVQPFDRFAHPQPLWGSLDNTEPRSVHANSIRALSTQNFTWVLPGHGTSLRAADPISMRNRLEQIAFLIDDGEGLERHTRSKSESDSQTEQSLEELLMAPPDYDLFDPELEGVSSSGSKPKPIADQQDDAKAKLPQDFDFSNANIQRLVAHDEGPIIFD